MKNVSTYKGAVRAFIDASPWLTDADLPALVTLKKLAAALDAGEDRTAVVAQFGLTFRNLQARAPQADGSGDDLLAQALADAEGH
ncbi:hypothetical protein [Demequina sp. NBRC 110055]|uniref:hypothetical protein n=1 Tax=Demequina sp. NBRC 110055 TaxID=1570344 RepID=UPI000A03FC12|nr:hypothetical protein [Demequina sp. NBRC 110055]